jgi:hypothetical protein
MLEARIVGGDVGRVSTARRREADEFQRLPSETEEEPPGLGTVETRQLRKPPPSAMLPACPFKAERFAVKGRKTVGVRGCETDAGDAVHGHCAPRRLRKMA